MSTSASRVAGAPISWGVNEVPGWGHQMNAERVLGEAASLGLSAVEAGPESFLPADPADASRLLSAHGLRLVGGFVPVVLHEAEAREKELASVERQAGMFSAIGADVLIVAASTGREDYEGTAELDEDSWVKLLGTLAAVEEIGARNGLTVAVHPHFGTVIERRHHLERFLEGCETRLCLDTGHLMVGGDDPVRVAEVARDRVGIVHLKDVDLSLAERVAAGELGYEDAVRRGVFRPLGDGDVETGRVISLLQQSGYEGWYVLEQDVMLSAEPEEGEGPVKDVHKSLTFLEGILDRGKESGV
ncbi:sugar phosphate isomerase/epimerase [soil metagenome]